MTGGRGPGRATATVVAVLAALLPSAVVATSTPPGAAQVVVNTRQTGIGVNVCGSGCIQVVQVVNVAIVNVSVGLDPAALPHAAVTPGAVEFGPMRVGRSVPARAISITNTGRAPLVVAGARVGGPQAADFALRGGSCQAATPQVLGPGSACSFDAVFTPRAVGPRLAAAGFSLDQVAYWVPLTGLGSEPAAVLSTAVLDFGRLVLGATAARDVVLRSTGLEPLHVQSIAADGDFAVSSDCPQGPGTALAPAATCRVRVAFKPSARGLRSGTLTVLSDVPGAPGRVALRGQGVDAAARVTPSALAFPATTAGRPAGSRPVVVANPGSEPLDIAGFGLEGPQAADFGAAGDCPPSLPPGGRCTIQVTFDPTAGGPAGAALAVRAGGGDTPQLVGLSGLGLAPRAVLTPAAVDFGAVPLGGAATRSVTLRNAGSAPLAVPRAPLAEGGAGFAGLSRCGPLLPPGGSCAIVLTFRPSAARLSRASVTIGAPGLPDTLTVIGRGLAPVPPPVLAPPRPPAPVVVPRARPERPEGLRGDPRPDSRPPVPVPERLLPLDPSQLTLSGGARRLAAGGRAVAAQARPVTIEGFWGRPLSWLVLAFLAALAALWLALLRARRPPSPGGLLILDDGQEPG